MTFTTGSGIEKHWMRKALLLAKKGLGHTSPNPMVGAVVVKNGRLIGQGYHHCAGEAHAEVQALRSLTDSPHGAELYVTLEPCSSWGRTPPCTTAILNAGITRVVIGSLDPNPKHAGRAVELLRSEGVEVIAGVEHAACEELNEAFFKWITTGRPFVLLKMAETLDGKIATENGSSQWITGEAARKQVQKLRMWADAVIAGAETFRNDHPRFTVRTNSGKVLKTPRRIIASRHPETLILPDPTWETADLSAPDAWNRFLQKLGKEGVLSILMEGGGELAASALRAGVVDKVMFYIAPKILGGRGSRSSVGGSVNPQTIGKALELERTSVKRIGADYLWTGYLKQENGKSCLPD